MNDQQLDGLEEFFDFTQLDRDRGLHVDYQELLPERVVPLSVLDSMDWQSTGLVESDVFAPVPSNFTYDVSMPQTEMDCLSPTSLHAPIESIHHQPDFHTSIGPGSATTILPRYQPIQEIHTAMMEPSITSFPVADPSRKLSVSIPTPNIEAPITSLPIAEPAGNQSIPAPLRRSPAVTRRPASATRKGASNRIPLEARQMLEEEFAANPYPCSWEIDVIAHQANLDVKRVRNWFNNTRARKKGSDALEAIMPKPDNNSCCSLASQLSRDSLEALDKQADETLQPPQPPLAVYLAQSYQEEAVTFSAIQAAIDNGSLSEEGDFQTDLSSSNMGKSGSVITSVNSSEGTAPTTYSSGSNLSSFNRDRRRGRRRMEWKKSPYTRTKLNGLNSAGQPQEDLPFCCTFCPRAFKTKYEWVRHEDSVHALRTTWICCDGKNAPLRSCPFCGQLRPDETHMAGHKYQQCRNKPESQRTFYRRDHFIQHLHHVHFANVKHPSVRLGCQARLMDSEGSYFGCKDLAVKWRRFGAPIKADDPMLHCGFCGKRSKNWSERCEHVAEHMYAGELDRTAWWAERLENHLENLFHPDAVGPFRCRYCQKVFANTDAMNKHSHCRVWSCRFLRSFDDVAAENAGPPLCPQFPSPKAHHCHLCGAGYRSFHVEHAQHYHKYRQCDQKLYSSEDEFLQHMHENHGASLPSLLKGSSIVEQNFSRNKGASFEPLHFDEIMQGCREATPKDSYVDPVRNKGPHPSISVAEPSQTPKPKPQPSTPTMRKKIQDQVSGSLEHKPSKTRRQRSDSASSKPAPPGPRFFRLSPLVPFLSSRIYYLRSAMPASLFPDGKAVLEEVPKSHIASLVMSSGLVGLAGVRFPLNLKSDGGKGPVEFMLDEDDG
ncbi:hypothetical protein P280DRAFT_436648 [Massarina eburnea CBS 473.64]|uniref:Homeobox domain-containing protein n=1 Tax=Massarina eburnea CBS 473.64 TaxID=1395130 RepID=A0A6A6RL65_9PLEO|nr:hypothetical protein P280DRAFT_436648 [Massarina eburnea CBS 473.64]